MPAPGAPVPFLDLTSLHQAIEGDIRNAVGDVLANSSFVGGPHLERFEDEWARRCGVAHAVGVGSGTDALELSLCALGIGPGDEVLVPANTFIATAEAVFRAGAVPVFTDVHDGTLLIDLEDAATLVGPRTAAVIPVHLYGQPVDMDALIAFARRHRLAVVEDAAQAHGARWRGRAVGGFGDAGCFSFYPGKNLGALGDGGAVVTNDAVLAARVRSLADHGRSHESKFVHERIGTNSRLDGIQAAVLVEKLRHLAAWTDCRRALAARYRELLVHTSLEPTCEQEDGLNVVHLFVVRADERDGLAAALADRGIGTGVHYPVPCHRQPAFMGITAPNQRPLPVTERAANRLLSLPLSPTMSTGQVDHVIETVLDAGWRTHSHPLLEGRRTP
jgi:dTDP-4-amino-4,6-dideoxygalactose transaminase